MPRYQITSPDGGKYEVTAPDGASEQDVLAYAQSQFKPKEKPLDPTEGMSGTDKFFAGMGKGIYDVGRGISQRFGGMTEHEVAEARRADEPLMKTGAGVAGNVGGSLMTLAPALAVPGANTVAGAAAVGALSGFVRPTTEGESFLKNTATDAALGGVSQWGLGKVAEKAMQRLSALREEAVSAAAKNAVRDTAVSEAQAAGYKTVPSLSGGSLAGRMIEGATGKEKAAQLAAVNNQPITDSIARKALGIADDVPLSKETMRAARTEAIETGYEPVRQLPFMATDDAFRTQISKLTSRADNASKDFGAIVESDVKPLAAGLLEVKGFSGSSAVDAVATFREKASDLYAAGNKTLGKAYREAAEAVENQIERALAAQGKDGAAVLKDYRDARVKVAQTFDLEKALREGQGSIDARVIGRLYAKAPDRMTGDIATIGKAAAAMPEVMAVPKAGWANPITAADSGVGTIGSILAGGPLPLAFPALRAAGRYGMMTGPGQRLLTTPKYGPGPIDTNAPLLLEALRQRAAGGTAGAFAPSSIYSAQE
jgi:hypothetical protein